jgi:pimeloyl-ACP methyl ester carboxylesterase
VGDIMRVKVNQIEINYEVFGKGQPLIMLHGNQEDYHIYDELIEMLKDNFTIYAIDSRNHGLSGRSIDFSYDAMTQDVYQFIRQLKINKPHILGFSDGGIIGLKLAIYAPNLIDRLIICGVNYHPKGLNKKIIKALKTEYKEDMSPYIKLMLEEPKIRKKDIKKVMLKTLILVGEKDVIKTKHTLKLHQMLKKSKLVILENETHDSFVVHSTKLAPYIMDFTKK